MKSSETFEVEVRGIRIEAETVRSFELWPVSGELPPFTAGAHIDVHLSHGMTRQYSLTNSLERHRYVIAVQRDPGGAGGSMSMHDSVALGSRLIVSAPRNYFPLNEAAVHSVLIAGGIGVTPLLAMVRRLCQLGLSWDFYYCARVPARAAFLSELKELAATTYPDRALHCVFDGEAGVTSLNLGDVRAAHRPDSDFYCCGPAPLMDAFSTTFASLPPERVHLEYFKAPVADTLGEAEGAFTVTLSRQGKTLVVPPNRSILEVLRENGVPMLSSCRQGICGTCETRVVEGVPDHRDHVLTPAERASNQTMMICVSRCKGEALTLDI
ncbi:PDR/VanB family oxidoreductase [Paraburkholderia phytofirmans]|uniref:Ferredoxin n=1 Tax=Paraburkholderia phytofirmans (strain DSM 17436 / LMG 22146 / PsJN) TaxID=398527 RepID=B2TEV1_PARPJ|nr:PDR/VanB family oxidoreductase [Paraburkholderia phytofirmans]ACD18622.1 ferredoxin [Paraburkholderia phytofirmans PsJN]